MATVRRFSRTDALGAVESTPQGGIRVPATVTRAGVFPYRLPDGSVRREYRPPEEVLAPESLATLKAAPVTEDHPADPVTPANWRAVAVGHVGEGVQANQDRVDAPLVIQDQGTIQKVNGGSLRECSCGYSCDLELSPGVTPSGEEFDAVQRAIRYNHVAIGPSGWGRQGPTVAMRLDSGDAIEERADAVEKETINGVEYVVGSPEWSKAIRGQRDGLQGRVDAAEKTAKTTPAVDPKVIHAAAQKRADLLVTAHQVAAKKGIKLDAAAVAEASNDGLALQLITMLDPDFPVDGKSPDYLAGALTMMVRSLLEGEVAEGEILQAPQDALKVEAQPGTEPEQNPPAQKTDAKVRSIWGARAGQAAPAQDAAKTDAGDAPDPDKARADSLARSRTRASGKLAFSK